MSGDARILALDIGSSSVRSRLYGADLRGTDCGAAAVMRYGWETAGGAMVTDAGGLLEKTAGVIDAALRAARAEGAEIAAVAVTTFWHSLVGCDSSGAPLTPVFAWGDSRAGKAAVTLHGRLDPERYHQRTGCFLHPSYPAAKLLWLRQTQPDLFASVARWLSFGAWLEWELFGSPRCSISIASGSGLLDGSAGDWDHETLGAVGVPRERLPPVVEREPRQGLRGKWLARWGALGNVPWYPALGDGGCANLGSAALGRDRPGITIGTSAAARIVWEAAADEPIPGDLWCYRLDGGTRVAGGALSNGGNGLAYLLGSFPQVEPADVSEALRSRDPDAHGLTVVPSLFRERTAGWPAESATIDGIRPGTTPLDIAVAWLESIAQRLGELVDRLERSFGSAAELAATGGAVHKVTGWLQTIADVTGRPVRLAADREATSRGAAIFVARELGWIQSLGPIPSGPADEPIANPVPHRQAIHGTALARQRTLSQAVRRAHEAAAATPLPAET